MLKLTGPRIARVMGHYNDALGLTPAIYRRGRAAIEKALGRGTHLTRSELAAALRAARIDTATERLTRVIMRAEVDGVICSGSESTPSTRGSPA